MMGPSVRKNWSCSLTLPNSRTYASIPPVIQLGTSVSIKLRESACGLGTNAPKSLDRKLRGNELFVPVVTSRRASPSTGTTVVLSRRGRGFQLFVRDMMSKTPASSANWTTLSSFWRPFGPRLTDVVPLAMSWNQVPLTGIVSTSVIVIHSSNSVFGHSGGTGEATVMN